MIKSLTAGVGRRLSRSLLGRVPGEVRSFSQIVAAGLSLVALPLQGETLLKYDTSLQPGDQAETQPSLVVEGLSAAPVIRGPGIEPSALQRSISSKGWNNINEGTPEVERLDPTRENALATGDFFEFSITVQPGYVGSLEALDHMLRRSAYWGPRFYEWQYSFDGFATPGTTIIPQGTIWTDLGWTESHFEYRGRTGGSEVLASNYNYMLEPVDGEGGGSRMPTFDLTGISALQNIPGGTTVTFRLYGWAGSGNTGASSTNSVAFGRDNPDHDGGPILSGSVIVDPDLGDEFPLLVVSEVAGADPADGLHSYPAGTEVTASASQVTDGADIRYLPLGWTGTGSVTSGAGASTTFTLNEASTIEWDWERQHRLVVNANGSGSVDVTTAELRPLLGWDFTGYVYTETLGEGEVSNADGVPTSTVAPELEPSVVARTPVYDESTEQGLRPANLGGGGLSSSMWRFTPNLAAAISAEKYYEFNVTPVAGESVSLHSLFFHYRYTASGPHSMALLYSVDDFATYDVIESFRMQDQDSGTQVASRTILLPSDPALQEVDSEITFRIYAWGGTGSGVGTFALRNAAVGVDDMILYGGKSQINTIADSEEMWLENTSLFNIEAVPQPGSIFTGWSGSFYSSVADLRGMDMRQPLVATATFATDSDDDGLADDWEDSYLTDFDPALDDDGDGFTNLEEYLRGTDPTQSEDLLAAGDVPLSMWENAQRDPILAGGFIIRDFGNGFRGAWDGSNDNRSAQDPFHPGGVPVSVVDNVSFDGPRMIVRADSWEEEWNDATVETVFSVGDDDGNTFFFRYQDELNWYRVSIAGQVSNATTRPLESISIQSRIDGQYSAVVFPEGPFTDPTDTNGYKRMRVRFTPRMEGGVPKIDIAVSGWEASSNEWQTASFGHREFTINDELGWGRAGFGTWAQAGFDGGAEWNPVNAGTLFESFQVTLNEEVVFDEDWVSSPEADVLPTGWTNPFAGNAELEGNWYVSAHGSIAETSSQGEPTSGTSGQHAADAHAPVLLAPSVEVSNYVLDLGIHPFDTGANGFVFDYVDENNYGRVLFANTIPGFDGSIPSGVTVSRKQGGVWSDLVIGDKGFEYKPGQPFHVSFMRSGNRYVMTARAVDEPDSIQRWEWTDASAPSSGGRYGFTSWQSGDAHFLFVEAYGAVAAVDGIAITGIEKSGEMIVLTVENPSGTPYSVERCLDLNTGVWETVDTDQTGTTWSGPIPAGAEKAFWRLTK